MAAGLLPPVPRELPALTDLRLEVRSFLAQQVRSETGIGASGASGH